MAFTKCFSYQWPCSDLAMFHTNAYAILNKLKVEMPTFFVLMLYSLPLESSPQTLKTVRPKDKNNKFEVIVQTTEKASFGMRSII